MSDVKDVKDVVVDAVFGTRKKALFSLFILAIIVLSVPLVVKVIMGDSSLIGYDSYYDVRIVEQYRSEGLSGVDSLTGKPVSFNLLHYVVAISGLDVYLVAKILPILAGILSLVVIYFLLKRLKLDEDVVIFLVLILLLSPVYIYYFTSFSTVSVAFLLLFISAYLYLRKSYLSAIVFSGVLLTGFTSWLVGLLFMVAFTVKKKEYLRLLFANVALSVVVLVLSAFFLFFNPLPDMIPMSSSFVDIFAFGGDMNGYSLIVLVLTIMGLFSAWRRHVNQVVIYSLIIVLFCVSIFYPSIRLSISVLLSGFASYAVNSLIKKEWNVPSLKWITLLLILCSLVFSCAVFLKNNISHVYAEKIDAVKYLSTSEPRDIVLSADYNGFMIEGLAGRVAYIDRGSYKFEDYDFRVNVSNQIYFSRNLEQLKKILEENGINHIFIDEEMVNGGVWSGKDEGVLFLFEFSKEFVKIFDNKRVRIYRYVGSPSDVQE